MTSIVFADNQAIFRLGIVRVIGFEDGLSIAAQCASLPELRAAITANPKSIVLWSSTLAAPPEPIVQSLTANGSRGIALVEVGEDVHPLIALGVHGIVNRAVSARALCEGFRAVARGEKFVNKQCSVELDIVGKRVLERLAPKEKSVAGLIAQGFKNKVIAEKLGTTEQVIKNYLRGIYDKTGVSDRLELALFVHHHPLLNAALSSTSVLEGRNYSVKSTSVIHAALLQQRISVS